MAGLFSSPKQPDPTPPPPAPTVDTPAVQEAGDSVRDREKRLLRGSGQYDNQVAGELGSTGLETGKRRLLGS